MKWKPPQIHSMMKDLQIKNKDANRKEEDVFYTESRLINLFINHTLHQSVSVFRTSHPLLRGLPLILRHKEKQTSHRRDRELEG